MREPLKLFTNSELFNKFPVFLYIVFHEIVKQTTTFTYQFQQTASRGMIFLIFFQMLSKMIDSLCKKSDLTFSSTSVGVVSTKLLENFFLVLCSNAHCNVSYNYSLNRFIDSKDTALINNQQWPRKTNN